MTRSSEHREGDGARAVPEWIGATPDSAIPDRVKVRIFLREGGRCHISGRKIGPADQRDFDHDPPLSMGGQNRESMIFPVLRDKHREKTAAEAGPRAKADRQRAGHLGLKKKAWWPNSHLTKGVDGKVRPRTKRAPQ